MKLGDLVDRISILELREFMEPRFRGHQGGGGRVEDDELARLKKELSTKAYKSEASIRDGEMSRISKLNTRIWMLQHAESEIAQKYLGRASSEAEALTAIGMIHQIVADANSLRAAAVAKLNGEAVRKVY